MNFDFLNNKRILIAGGTGSFGKNFAKFLLNNFQLKKVIIFSRDELKQSEIAKEISDERLAFFLGDIRDLPRLQRAFRGVDIVVHAAALKQVPTLEYNPFEAVKTNIIGSQNVINAAIDQKVEKVILLSTDKAVQPINLYGSTKLCAEKLFIDGNSYSGTDVKTKFSCVRYGNVIGSRGSVVDVVLKNFGRQKMVSLTDERMTRFWITLNQAFDLVFFALENMAGGEIFIPKAPSMKLVDLFDVIAPGVPKQLIGIRPGEKLHEVLITNEEAVHSRELEDYFVILPEHRDFFNFNQHFEKFLTSGKKLPDDFCFESSSNCRWLTKEALAKIIVEKYPDASGDIFNAENFSRPQESPIQDEPLTAERKFIPYARQSINQDDIDAVTQTLKSDFLTTGPKVKEFEQAVASYCGRKYAIAVSNATAGLKLAFLAAGLKAGDEAITSPNTFVATANMLLEVGVKPVFSDIRLDSYNLDEARIEQFITEKTKAIVPVDFAGQPCQMEEIEAIAEKYGLAVITDAAHSLGASQNGWKAGRRGDLAVFSFHPIKPITTGEGGMIVTDDLEYYQKLSRLRHHGIYKDDRGKNVMTEFGYNFRLTDIAAGLGISQLKRLDEFIEKRRRVVDWYFRELQGLEEIILPIELPGNYSGWHLFVVRLKNFGRRDELMAYLKERRVGVNFHFPAVYSHPYYRENGYREIKLGNEEIYHYSAITLPCHPGLTKEEVAYVARTIKEFFKK